MAFVQVVTVKDARSGKKRPYAYLVTNQWNPERKIAKSAFPTLGRINADTYGVDADDDERRLAEDYARNLY